MAAWQGGGTRMERMEKMDLITEVVRPLKQNAAIELGTNFGSRCPDVEVLAMTMNDIPMTPEMFREKSLGKSWMKMNFMVLKVGPAGFSTVPYSSSGKKKNNDVSPQPLYENDATYGTTFFTFEKASNNKDRGSRVGEYEEEGRTINLKTNIRPGLCLSFFMDEDQHLGENSKFFVERASETGILPAFSFVYLQMASANIEAAKKGNGIKVKKLKLVEQDKIAQIGGSVMKQLPTSKESFENIMQAATEVAASQRLVCNTRSKFFALCPQNAYVGHDAATNEWFISGCGDDVDDIYIDCKHLCDVTSCANERDALKFLNIALAMNAVSVCVRNANNDGVSFEDGPANKAVIISIDYNVMFSFEDIHDAMASNMLEHESEAIFVGKSGADISAILTGDALQWMNKSQKMVDPARGTRRVCFKLQAGETMVEEDKMPASSFISKGFGTTFHRLSVHMVNDTGELVEEGEARTLILDLEVRPDLRSSSSTGKRKRLSMF